MRTRVLIFYKNCQSYRLEYKIIGGSYQIPGLLLIGRALTLVEHVLLAEGRAHGVVEGPPRRAGHPHGALEGCLGRHRDGDGLALVDVAEANVAGL